MGTFSGMTARWWAGVAVAGALLAGCALAGCADDVAQPDVLVPGAPGEAAQVLPADEVDRSDPAPTAADVAYLEQMIPHHEQAVLMTDLAAGRAVDPQVLAIAARINGTQLPEISAMQQLLTSFDVGDAHGSGHGGGQPADHSDMPGMATQGDLERLRDTSGAEFEALFLDLMVAHHQGALTMATELLGTDDVDAQVELIASDVVATQNAEIRAMEEMAAAR